MPIFMMIGFACVTFCQVDTASAQVQTAAAQPAAPGGPSQTTWLLDNVKFADGGTANGFFTLNSGYTALTAWNIQVSADKKNPNYTAFTYSNTSGGYQLVLPLDGDTVYAVFSKTLSRGLALAFENPLQNSGGSEKLIVNSPPITSEEQIIFPLPPQPTRFITSGSVTEVAIPEPGTMASFALGIVALMSQALSKQIRTTRAIFPAA